MQTLNLLAGLVFVTACLGWIVYTICERWERHERSLHTRPLPRARLIVMLPVSAEIDEFDDEPSLAAYPPTVVGKIK